MQSYIVVGGGLAGLTAANALAGQGFRVTVLEQSDHLGGRAITRREQGYSLNLGPHALYTGGLARKTFLDWKIPFTAHPPVTGNTAFLVYRGEKYPLFEGTAGLLRTRMLSLREKIDAGRALSGLKPSTALPNESMEEWILRHGRTEPVRQILQMLTRITTYAADHGRLHARAALRQLAMAYSTGVQYIDGGWQTLIDGLAVRARSLGVEIRTGVAVDRLPDGTGVVLAVSPSAAERIAGRRMPVLHPARMATLELGLRGLPAGVATAAFGVDTPFYYSMHSAAARLAPEGAALVHVGKYLREGETATRDELETFTEQVLPGWRAHVELARYLPNLVVTHAVPGAPGRPDTEALGREGVVIAGDWVGADGMLSDAAVASGLHAAAVVQRQQVRAA
jgi:hypothetical protein